MFMSGDLMRFKDIKKEMRRKDAEIQKLKETIRNLKTYEENHYPYNYLEVIIRPQRLEFLHPYEFDVDLTVVDEPPAKTVAYRQRFDLKTLDLVPDKRAFAETVVRHMVEEILAAVGKE